jgi:Cdc6-like AAA superfamily ATPase
MLYGPRRIGKTSLQYELCRRLKSLKDGKHLYVPALIDLQGTPEEQFFTVMMRDILEACQPLLDDKLESNLRNGVRPYEALEFSQDLRRLLEHMEQRTARSLRLVLLIDEVDELNKYSEETNKKLRSIFMKTFAENIVAVMSGTHIRKTWKSETSPWYNFFEEIEISPLAREDAIRLICKPVQGIFSYEAAAIDRIVEYSEGSAYIIQRFCIHVINRAIERKRRRVTIEDVDAVRREMLEQGERAA